MWYLVNCFQLPPDVHRDICYIPREGKVRLGHHAPVDRSRQVEGEICRALPDSCEECFRCWYSDCDERFI